MPKYGCINVHASLLPKYRGAAPIHYAIMQGEKESGVTIMQMDIGMDTGDMLKKLVDAAEENGADSAGCAHFNVLENGESWAEKPAMPAGIYEKDAIISGIGSFALCWLASKYFPDRFDPWDSIPYSILIGFLGIGRVLEWVAKRYGIEGVQTEKIDNEQGK